MLDANFFLKAIAEAYASIWWFWIGLFVVGTGLLFLSSKEANRRASNKLFNAGSGMVVLSSACTLAFLWFNDYIWILVLGVILIILIVIAFLPTRAAKEYDQKVEQFKRGEITFSSNFTPSSSSQTPQNISVNTCPKCGEKLIQRQNRKTAQYFTGCSAYPRCRYTE